MSGSKKADYNTWAGAEFSLSRDYGTLEDDVGNSYKRITFGYSSKPVGRKERESVYPQQQIEDVLVFEKPVATAAHLDLELPGENVSGSGMIRIRIPASTLERAP